jgi:hypothetical protein
MNNLTEEQKKKLQNMGALGYSPELIAEMMDLDLGKVEKDFIDSKSDLYKLYNKGKNQANYLIDLKLFEMAQSGDLKAIDKLTQRKEDIAYKEGLRIKEFERTKQNAKKK